MSKLLNELREKSFEVSWGPSIGRKAGYYVSIPEYNGGTVVPLAEVEALFNQPTTLLRLTLRATIIRAQAAWVKVRQNSKTLWLALRVWLLTRKIRALKKQYEELQNASTRV